LIGADISRCRSREVKSIVKSHVCSCRKFLNCCCKEASFLKGPVLWRFYCVHNSGDGLHGFCKLNKTEFTGYISCNFQLISILKSLELKVLFHELFLILQEVELTAEMVIAAFKDQLNQSNTVLFVKDQITAKLSTGTLHFNDNVSNCTFLNWCMKTAGLFFHFITRGPC
jgi:hypothetical protein